VTNLDLLCTPNYRSLIAMVGAITLFGCLNGSLFISPQADHYGRRPMIITLLLIQTLALTSFLLGMLLLKRLWVICLSCFTAGAVSTPLVSVVICFVSELAPDHMSIVTGASFFAEAATSILVGLWFTYFKNCATFYITIAI
jgi:MFS family permease